jgi:hypothetical protein
MKIMKKTINVLLVLLMGWMSAVAQNANPYISISTNPSVVPIPSGGGPGGNSNLQIIAGNAGTDNIAAQSLEITISTGFNAEIIGLAGGSDTRWTVVPGSLVTGANGSIKLRNTAGPAFGAFDLGIVNLTIRAVAAGGPALIGSNVSYIFGINPNTGAQSSAQGNTSPTDDNSTTSLTASSTLPVTLSDVSADAASCNGVITWRTATEDNVDRFEVEYSKSLNSPFEVVGTVSAKNSANGSTYKYVNNQGTGRGYYRLKMIDKDGTVTYSKIVVVDTKCSGSKTISVYPNPLTVNQTLNVIASGFEGTIKGELVSMSGQVVRTYTLKNGSNTLPVEKIAQATYMLRVSDAAGDAESFRLVIIK